MALLLVTYPVSRFLIEWLRNDEGAFFAGLTISQNISVGLFAVGLAFWGWLRTRREGSMWSGRRWRGTEMTDEKIKL